MKGKQIFAIIGWGALGVCVLSFVLRALWHVQSGQDVGYYNVKHQPMTYLGALATLALAGLVLLIGLYHRIKRAIEKRRTDRPAEPTAK